MKRQKANRKARAIAAQKRRIYFEVLLGAGLAAALILPAFFSVPIGSPRQMVMAQVKRGEPIESPTASNTLVSAATRLATAGADRIPFTNAVAKVTTNDPAQPGRKYRSVGFDKLASFPFEVTESIADETKDPLTASLKTTQQIPVGIKALNDTQVSVNGFMLPTKVEKRAVTEFLLLRNQGACCYGVVPKINEWITVRMVGKGVKPIMDQPITAYGTLHVEEVRENGYLVGIYRIDGDKISAPGD